MNLFLTLVIPVSIVFTAISTVYYSTDFIFSKAIRLGTISGVFIGISLSLLLAFILILIRILHKYKKKSTLLPSIFSLEKNSIVSDSPIQKKQTETTQKVSSQNKKPMYSHEIEEKFMLLMNKELAYDVSLTAINHDNLGVIVYKNKDEGSIVLEMQNEEIHLTISSLTKHTSEIQISGTIDNSTMKNIISSLKEKEHAFIQY